MQKILLTYVFFCSFLIQANIDDGDTLLCNDNSNVKNCAKNTDTKANIEYDKMVEMKKYRKPNYSVDEIFVNRWSPRAMSGESITKKELMTTLEAASLAPSSYNNQPWRFIYVMRDTPAWNVIFDTLVDFNKKWAKNAGALVAVISNETLDWNKQPSITHSFDAGAACMNMALQGSLMGLVVHGMEGFDYDALKKALNVPEGYAMEAVFAIGHPGQKKNLPKGMQDQEKPSTRKPLKEIVFEGTFEK